MIIGAEISLSKDRKKEEYEEALHDMLEEAEKLENIIAALFNLAQADLEYGSSQTEDVRVDEMIWKIQSEWNQKKGQHKLNVDMINLPMDNDAVLIVSANPTLLQIALDNVISNAFKFSDDQQVDCVLEVKSKALSITISDKGNGIPVDQQSQIFKPFYSSSAKIEHAGNGMGLYMAHKIITLVGGNITIKSSNGAGTTFLIEFHQF